MLNLTLTVLGFALAVAGVYVLWGLGVACLVAGAVLFAAGGLGSAREAR